MVKDYMTIEQKLAKDYQRMLEAHRRLYEDSGWCAVCDQHEHAKDCPLYEAADEEDEDE